jgi:hypothetical protein
MRRVQVIKKLPQTLLFLSDMELASLDYRKYHHRVFSLKLLLDIATFQIIMALQVRKRELCLRLDVMWVNGWMWPVEYGTRPNIVGC